MAVRVKSISDEKELSIPGTERGSFTLIRRDEYGWVYLPFAYASSAVGLKAVEKGEKIPFSLSLRPGQIAPSMVIRNRLNTEGVALCSLGCGDGKTVISIHTVCTLSPRRTLIVINRTTLFEQWDKEFQNCTGERAWPAEKPEEVGEGARVVVVMVHVMNRLPPWFLSTVDLLIVDECDTIAGPVHASYLMHCTPKRVIGLTATPDDIETGKLKPVVRLIYGAKPIMPSSRKPFKVIRIKTKWVPDTSKKRWRFDRQTKRRREVLDWDHAMTSLALNEERNAYIRALTSFILGLNGENIVLILCKRIPHVKALSSLFTAKGIDNKAIFGSKNPTTCSRLYIGTYSKLQAGFDEKSLVGFQDLRINYVILASDIIDPRQSIGRAFRSAMPTVIELLDDMAILNSDRSATSHCAIRGRWYKENGALSINTYNIDEFALE